jgi:hypothetical protein
LLMQFESLGGGGHGCEFGIFQRHFGAEPLSLLRWADVYQEQLSQALETEFAGVGDPEFTNIFVPANNSNPEYWTTDTRYHMAMRSFVLAADVPLDRMREQVTKRFRYLSRKLIEDLRSASKVFVYKNMKRNLMDTELRRLHAACRQYGENTLFYIRYEDAAHPCGTVTMERDGLMIGYIDHFSHTPDTDKYIEPANDSLLTLCKNAYALWRSAESTTIGAPYPGVDLSDVNEDQHRSQHVSFSRKNSLIRQSGFAQISRQITRMWRSRISSE